MPEKKRPRRSGAEGAHDDAEIFRRAMAGTRPLANDNTAPPSSRRRPPRARFSREDRHQVLRESLEADVDVIEAQNGDSLWYAHPSVGRKTLKRLARGRFSVQAETDLHGLTAAEARTALFDFIHECRHRGYTCVRVVHGKGRRSGQNGPVLKRKVDLWLRRWEGVLAFVSARQVDGGSGAVYVLLRKPR